MTSQAIKRLPVNTGISGWEAISKRRTPILTLDGDATADWLIIGGGFAGLSAARRLSQRVPGEKIVVLDAAEIATGTAGRNSGFMIDVPHNLAEGEYSAADEKATRLEIAQNRFAIQFAADAAADYGMSKDTFDPSGKINAAATARGLKLNGDFAESLARIGEGFQVLDRAAMRDITGSDYYLAGLRTPGAVMIQPADYIRGFAAGLGSKIDLFEHSPVVELSHDGRNWKAATKRGSVSAPKVILGVNGHIQDFGHFTGRLLHIFTYASMTAGFRDKSGAEKWGLLPADPMGATVRKFSSGGLSRIVIRTRFTCDQSLRVSDTRVAAITAEQRHAFDRRFPQLAQIPFEFSWAGALCLSRNHVPAFGEVEENLYSACCENGLGTVKSTLAGVMAADLATGTPSDILPDYRNQPLPSWLPPEPLTSIGANAFIRFQELRAGREG